MNQSLYIQVDNILLKRNHKVAKKAVEFLEWTLNHFKCSFIVPEEVTSKNKLIDYFAGQIPDNLLMKFNFHQMDINFITSLESNDNYWIIENGELLEDYDLRERFVEKCIYFDVNFEGKGLNSLKNRLNKLLNNPSLGIIRPQNISKQNIRYLKNLNKLLYETEIKLKKSMLSIRASLNTHLKSENTTYGFEVNCGLDFNLNKNDHYFQNIDLDIYGCGDPLETIFSINWLVTIQENDEEDMGWDERIGGNTNHKIFFGDEQWFPDERICFLFYCLVKYSPLNLKDMLRIGGTTTHISPSVRIYHDIETVI